MCRYIHAYLCMYIYIPNFVWHIDQYDKIAQFGICIHSCIDGFVNQRNWPLTVSKAWHFMTIASHVKLYGCTLKVLIEILKLFWATIYKQLVNLEASVNNILRNALVITTALHVVLKLWGWILGLKIRELHIIMLLCEWTTQMTMLGPEVSNTVLHQLIL